MTHYTIHAEHVRKFTTPDGRAFNVYYVATGGQTYRIPAATGDYKADKPTAEFYDAEYIGKPAAQGHELGQFTGASYYVDTLLGFDQYSAGKGGLALHGGVPAWDIDARTMGEIRVWVAQFGAPSAEKARILAGHPAHQPHGWRPEKYREHYGPAEAFRPYTGAGSPFGEKGQGGWYAITGVADCGHEYTNVGADGLAGLSTGYASDIDGRRICIGCADDIARAQLSTLHGDGAMVAYVSGDGTASSPYRLATWTGGELARVVYHRVSRNNIGRVWVWVFEDANGRTYHGRNGGPGMVVRVRAHTRRPSYLPKLNRNATKENDR